MRFVGPDHPDDLALAVVERDQQPVVVPGVRAAAVQHRGVGAGSAAQEAARLLARDQEAALDLEALVEQEPEVLEPGGRAVVLHRPAHRRAYAQPARVGIRQVDRHLVEAERGADPLAYRAEDRLDRARLGDLGRDAQEVLEGVTVASGPRLLLGGLDRERRMGGHGHQHVEFLVAGLAARGRLVDRDHPQRLAVRPLQGDDERVLGVPGAGVVARLDVGDEAGLLDRGPVEGVVLDEVGPPAQEALLEQRRPVLPLAHGAHQDVARGIASVHGRDPVVVPLGPVQGNDHCGEAERLGNRARDGVQQAVEVLIRAQEPRQLEEAAQVRHRGSLRMLRWAVVVRWVTLHSAPVGLFRELRA